MYNIMDGTGTSSLAGVDSGNRLLTRSITSKELLAATLNGGGFLCTFSQILTLTSDSESAIAYFKTNETSDLIVTALTVCVGASDGTGEVIYTQYGNPTAGTIIGDENPGIILNKNVGSTEALDSLFYYGGEAETFTESLGSFDCMMPSNSTKTINYESILTKGASLGLSITPPTGNTSMKVTFAVEFYKLNKI